MLVLAYIVLLEGRRLRCQKKSDIRVTSRHKLLRFKSHSLGTQTPGLALISGV